MFSKALLELAFLLTLELIFLLSLQATSTWRAASKICMGTFLQSQGSTHLCHFKVSDVLYSSTFVEFDNLYLMIF